MGAAGVGTAGEETESYVGLHVAMKILYLEYLQFVSQYHTNIKVCSLIMYIPGIHVIISLASIMLSGHTQVYFGGCLPT